METFGTRVWVAICLPNLHTPLGSGAAPGQLTCRTMYQGPTSGFAQWCHEAIRHRGVGGGVSMPGRSQHLCSVMDSYGRRKPPSQPARTFSFPVSPSPSWLERDGESPFQVMSSSCPVSPDPPSLVFSRSTACPPMTLPKAQLRCQAKAFAAVF